VLIYCIFISAKEVILLLHWFADCWQASYCLVLLFLRWDKKELDFGVIFFCPLVVQYGILFLSRTRQVWCWTRSGDVIKWVVLWCNEIVPRQICHRRQKTLAVSQFTLQVVQICFSFDLAWFNSLSSERLLLCIFGLHRAICILICLLYSFLYLLVSWAWWDWPLTWLTNHCHSVLWHCWLGHLTRKIVPKITCNVLSGTPYCTFIPFVQLRKLCFRQFDMHQVNTAWSDIFMHSCVLNKWATFGAKIFTKCSDFCVGTFYFASPCIPSCTTL